MNIWIISICMEANAAPLLRKKKKKDDPTIFCCREKTVTRRGSWLELIRVTNDRLMRKKKKLSELYAHVHFTSTWKTPGE